MKARKRKLTEKQRLFVQYYTADPRNLIKPVEACRKAGYKGKNIYQQAYYLLNSPATAHVREAIADAMKRHTRDIDISAERILKELAGIAFNDPSEIFSDDGKTIMPISSWPPELRRSIEFVETLEQQNGRTVKRVKFASKEKALELLGRYQSLFIEVLEAKRQLLEHETGRTYLTEDEIMARIEAERANYATHVYKTSNNSSSSSSSNRETIN